PGGVEEDEWAVADPAAFSAGIAATGRKTQVGADPAQRIVHGAVFVSAEVVNVDGLVDRVNGEHHGGNAILDVEVRLALFAVAQDVDLVRIAEQLVEEVEDVSVRVMLAQDGDEAEDVTLEAKARAVGGDQPLAGDLGGGVEAGLHRERRVL